MPYPSNALLDRPQPERPAPMPRTVRPAPRDALDDMDDDMLDAYLRALARPPAAEMPPTLTGIENQPRRSQAELAVEAACYRPPPAELPSLASVAATMTPEEMAAPAGGEFLESLQRAPTSGIAARPQTMTEAEDLREQGRTVAPAYLMGVPLAAAGPVFRTGEAAAGTVVRGVAELGRRVATRFPATTAGVGATATAGTTLTALPGETQTPDPLQETRSTLARLRARQTELEKEEEKIKAAQQRFSQLDRSNTPEAIAAMKRTQEELQSRGLY